jgi:hypothetical protein
VPDFEMRLSKFERMCIVRWVCGWVGECRGLLWRGWLLSGAAHAPILPCPAI